jgi:nucleotide-binding universal stress UspA family protein
MTAPIAEPGRIVVGVDGSDQSKIALRWARHLAEITGSRVEAVMAWHPFSYVWTLAAPEWDPRDDAEKALRAIIEEVWEGERPAGVRAIAKEGIPAKVLLDQSKDATMLVLGSRGHGGFAGLLLGSVSASCAAHATCPVLVVHGDRLPSAA